MNKHISIKVKLEKLLWKKMNYDNLYDAITRTNILIDNGSLFIRSYILYVIEYNKNNWFHQPSFLCCMRCLIDLITTNISARNK